MPDLTKAIQEMNACLIDTYGKRAQRRRELQKGRMVVTNLESYVEMDTALIEQMTAAVTALGGTPVSDPESPEGQAEQRKNAGPGGVFGGFVPRENLA